MAYSCLVTGVGVPQEVLSGLKYFERRDLINDTLTSLIRIYNPNDARRADIRDFTSFDRYPELILREGRYNQATGENFPRGEKTSVK